MHTFLHSFFSFSNVFRNPKDSSDDPGCAVRHIRLQLPPAFLSHWVTFYTDGLVHDDVSPVSAPRRAGYRPGIYLARFPGLQHMDLRLEGANTEPASHSGSDGIPINHGQFLYYE